MYHLINGTTVNLPIVMMEQMKEAIVRFRACLPYAMVLTLIIRELGISLDSEISQTLMHTDYYNKQSLHQIRYRKVEDHLIRRISGQEPTREANGAKQDMQHDIEPQTPPARVSSPPPVETDAPPSEAHPSNVQPPTTQPPESCFALQSQTQTITGLDNSALQRIANLLLIGICSKIERHHFWSSMMR